MFCKHIYFLFFQQGQCVRIKSNMLGKGYIRADSKIVVGNGKLVNIELRN